MTVKVAGYVLDELIGYGATSAVWRGRSARSGYPVALKRIPSTDIGQVAAARSEAALLAALDHPHLIRLHELVTAADAVTLVLDLADGGSLADLLAVRGRLTQGEVAGALAPIGAALAHAHAAQIVHGDVSAGNVLFTRAGLPLLSDLGLARIHGRWGLAHGTPAYIDPAVAQGCVPGPQSDVFSLAALAVHALTGTPLWTGYSGRQQLASAATGAELDALEPRFEALSPELADVLRQALVLDPSRRCTAAEFALDLRHSVEPVPVELAAGRARSVLSGLRGPAERDQPEAGSLRPHRAGRHRRGAGGEREVPGAGLAFRSQVARRGLTPGGAAIPRSVATSPSGRPSFERPGSEPADPGERVRRQLTHGVRIPPRPPEPSWPRLMYSRMTGRGIGAAALVLICFGAGLTWWLWPARGSSPSRSPQSAPAAAHPSPGLRSSAAPPLAAVLANLDEVRAQAFAAGDGAPLDRVYLPGPLLDEDRALLRRMVPAGCGLHDMRTSFEDVRLLGRTAGRTAVLADATLSAGQLICGGGQPTSIPGTPRTVLHIELAEDGAGYRIASQRAEPGSIRPSQDG